MINHRFNFTTTREELSMKVQAYVSFSGRCEEALEFYKKTIGAEVISLMRWKESPDEAIKSPPGYEEKVMNATFRVGETALRADDGMGEKQTEFKGVTPAIDVADDAEAKRIFSSLGAEGAITMPLAKTFWTSSFGMLTDKFGGTPFAAQRRNHT